MCQRTTLHRLVDALSDEDLTTAGRVLAGLAITANPVERALLLAPMDDESDAENEDGDLAEAREEMKTGGGLSTTQLRRELGLG